MARLEHRPERRPEYIEVTKLLSHLEMMIGIADRLAEKTPYPPSIKKVRDAAQREADRTRRLIEPR